MTAKADVDYLPIYKAILAELDRQGVSYWGDGTHVATFPWIYAEPDNRAAEAERELREYHEVGLDGTVDMKALVDAILKAQPG